MCPVLLLLRRDPQSLARSREVSCPVHQKRLEETLLYEEEFLKTKTEEKNICAK